MLRRMLIALLVVALLAGCGAGAVETEKSGASVAASSPQEVSRDEDTPADTAAQEALKPRAHYLPRRMTESRQPDPKERFRVGDTEYYIFNPELVVVSDSVEMDYVLYYRSRFEQLHLANSHEVIQSISYLDYWYRNHVSYYPVFADEINYTGGPVIARYYADIVDNLPVDVAYNAVQTFERRFVLPDFGLYLIHYSYCDYAVVFADPYLTVYTFYAGYGGGARDFYNLAVEVFDMRTGQLLTYEDVFDTSAVAMVHYTACLKQYTDPGDEFLFYDEEDYRPFSLEEDAVVFVFNAYDAGFGLSGTRKIRVPYEALEPCLLIEPPFAAL